MAARRLVAVLALLGGSRGQLENGLKRLDLQNRWNSNDNNFPNDDLFEPTEAPTAKAPSAEPTTAAPTTAVPSYEPTPAPSPEPTFETTSCPEDPDWFKHGKPHQNCAWVGKNPENRCYKVSNSSVPAHAACQRSCGCSYAPTSHPTYAPSPAPSTYSPTLGPTSDAPTLDPTYAVTASTCYADENTTVADCVCFRTCATCGFGAAPVGAADCLTCAHDLCHAPLVGDAGPGTCAACPPFDPTPAPTNPTAAPKPAPTLRPTFEFAPSAEPTFKPTFKLNENDEAVEEIFCGETTRVW